jgi:hypothetical protein
MLGAEYWDSPGSKVLFAYGYVKALVAGKTPDTGENAKGPLRAGLSADCT